MRASQALSPSLRLIDAPHRQPGRYYLSSPVEARLRNRSESERQFSLGSTTSCARYQVLADLLRERQCVTQSALQPRQTQRRAYENCRNYHGLGSNGRDQKTEMVRVHLVQQVYELMHRRGVGDYEIA